MYRYDDEDKQLVRQRAAQFGDQVRRRLSGALTEDEFKPLRLQNGLYMQLHAYMMRIAIPYGLLSSEQVRKIAHITREYDRGYAHFTTRQNVQLNWPKLEDVPKILEELAEVEMHAIQTSGNCIRNVTSDPWAGVAADELEDPRPWCELLRQWSTFHPEFAFLPRKFKIAVTGASEDRAAIAVHDIGLRLVEKDGEVGFSVWVGGGQGRTPLLAVEINEFLPKKHLLSYCEAILRVYNRDGRRDNKFKARIKILVKQLGRDAFKAAVEEEWDRIRDSSLQLTDEDVARFTRHFEPPQYESFTNGHSSLDSALLSPHHDFRQWVKANVTPHKVRGYAICALALKSRNRPPGDVTDAQLDAVADVADEFSMGRVVVTHRQNLVLSDVPIRDLRTLYDRLVELDLATPAFNRVTDIIACPGLDYCNLANARSIGVAQDIQDLFEDFDEIEELGDVTLNISGCINACGHHHVGNIGILGIDKQGVEHYQLMLGGSAMDDAAFGKTLGRALTAEEIAPAVQQVLQTYLSLREAEDEPFLATYRRVGAGPFKEAVYENHQGPADLRRSLPDAEGRRLAAAAG